MKRYRLLIWWLLLAVLAVAAYFFGLYNPPAGEKKQPPQAVTLEFYQQREEAMTGFTAVIERFAKDHPSIELFQRNVPNTQELLVARIRSGDIPDLFTDWPTQRNFAVTVSEGAVIDLADQSFIQKVSPRALQMIKQGDGKIYALPINYNCMEVYYNKEIFERMGLKVPKTVGEFMALCDELASKGIMPMVFCIRDYGRMSHVAQMLLAALTDDYLDVMQKLRTKQVTEDTKEKVLSVLRLFRTLYLYSQAQGEKAYTYYDACESFAGCGAAMMISGSYALNTINSFETGIQMDVFPFPGETEERRRVMLSNIDTAICVSSSSPYRAEALTFLNYLTEPDNSTLYASLDLGPSCLMGVNQENPVTQRMSEHIETYDNANWLKSRFSLETVSLFGDAVGAYLISGDEQTLWAALLDAFSKS
jgi:raffinose/stachyose/melibiose transport system substrate-binding protein